MTKNPRYEITYLTKRKLTRSEEKDLFFGGPVSEALARFGVGRSIIVKERDVLAVEANEGIEETVRRTRDLNAEGFTLFLRSGNLPTPPEPLTAALLEEMNQTGGKVLAMDSSYPIADQPTFIRLAQRLGITVIRIQAKEEPDRE